ncbi:glutathione S-transferase-like [Chelonus insularis]|uniref:glutathione S-transferase-like n=1 Tax=Chelonus insularis TaxID=460826 RepID=UPI00158F611C|nr:glutathione S-transferase-like [Chelonus insularis]XP_034938354.1 glutathione S-transferase-like [Chelonus insularis]
MMRTYKLTYFNVMGLGEPIRFLLSYGGYKFEDIRIAREEWPKMKASTPFGQLPVLEIDGKPYGQTLPICRFLAKELDLNGKTDVDDLEIGCVAHALHDLRKQVALFYLETDSAIKATKKAELIKNTLPFYLEKFENIAAKNKGYFHDGKLSYADLFFVAIHDSIQNVCEVNITENRPNLQSIREKVLSIPQIKVWVDKRPKLEF